MRSIVWFRGKDLRTADHRPLSEAVATGDVIPLFVVDPFFFAPERSRQLPQCMQFLLESLRVLEGHFANLGSRLLVVKGRSVDAVPRLAQQWKADRVLAHRWVEPFGRERDRQVEAALDRQGIRFELFEGENLLPPGSVRNTEGGMFRVFTPFAKAAAARLGSEPALPSPRSLPPLPRFQS